MIDIEIRAGEWLVSDREEIVTLLKEIRDNQRSALQRQEEHLEVARQQMERSRGQVQQSIELQKAAMNRVKQISRIAIPGIALCVVLIVYLLVKYF
jgi:CBS-domain-containing membrane protein